MKRVFKAGQYFTVPDGTEVSPFLNASDVMQVDVPWGLLGEMSIASGRMRSGVHSWVHIHPAVTQVTYVTGGRLTIRMKERDALEPYDLNVATGHAVVSEPGTLFQLRNDSGEDAEVLYIVSPSYAFEGEEGKPHGTTTQSWWPRLGRSWPAQTMMPRPFEKRTTRLERSARSVCDGSPQRRDTCRGRWLPRMWFASRRTTTISLQTDRRFGSL